MRLIIRHKFILIAILGLFGNPVAGRRGGGSSGGGSDGNGDSSDNDSGGGSSTPCVNTGQLYIDDLPPTRFDNYTKDSAFGGAYYLGEASLQISVAQQADGICETASTALPLPDRLFGAAWIGPQAPHPEGPENGVVIGFKAWVSDSSVDNINLSYNTCAIDADSIFFRSTSWFTFIYPNNEVHGARDTVPLSLSSSPNDSLAAVFNGAYVNAPEKKWNNISYGEWSEDEFVPPEGLCRGYSFVDDSIPEATTINGSITRETLALTVSGVMAGRVFGVNVSFVVDFKGTYDAANSTQAVIVGKDSPLLSFEVTRANENGQGKLDAVVPALMASLLVTMVLAFDYCL